MGQPKKQQSLLEEAGVEIGDVKMFFKPEGKKKRVTVTGIRVPKGDAALKQLPDEMGVVKILAILDVKESGVPATWEVTSKRAIIALDQVLVGELPIDLTVRTIGKGTATSYEISSQLVGSTDVDQDDQDVQQCDAPRCALDAGHSGKHKTKAALDKELGKSKATQLEA